MPDITMCANDKCAQRMTCYRYMAYPSSMQSYCSFYPDEYGICKDWLPIDGKNVRTLTEEEKQELLDVLAGALI